MWPRLQQRTVDGTVAVMDCQIEWVEIERVELLWAQFVLDAYDAAIALRIESMQNNIHLAEETADILLWALEEGGYWWCETCRARHIFD